MYKRDVAARKLKILEGELEASLNDPSDKSETKKKKKASQTKQKVKATETITSPEKQSSHKASPSKRKRTETVTSPDLFPSPRRRTESEESTTSSIELPAPTRNASFIVPSPSVNKIKVRTASESSGTTSSQANAKKYDKTVPMFSPEREPKFRADSQSSETPSVDAVKRNQTKLVDHGNEYEETHKNSLSSNSKERKSKDQKRTQDDSDVELNNSMDLSDVKKAKKRKFDKVSLILSPKREPNSRTNSETHSIDSVNRSQTKLSGEMATEHRAERKSTKKKGRTLDDSNTILNNSMTLSDDHLSMSTITKERQDDRFKRETSMDLDDSVASETIGVRKSNVFDDQSLLSSTKLKEDTSPVKSSGNKTNNIGEPVKPPR